MQINFLVIGKTSESFLTEGIFLFEQRIKRYTPYEHKVIPALKHTQNMSPDVQKAKEADLLLPLFQPQDFVILLDERGKNFSSVEFADYLQKHYNQSTKTLWFVVGGPYGFAPSMYERANMLLSLSKMTFSHQLIRLIFAEQLYRAFTILRNEPYHNE